ncbi:threonine ammonia-lyase [Paramaledivibacter caminithermalis]|uniref:threonine ammonia-lyase n=1 Tax=Paramaledivibacter caminithermalis (strain DSM 15212 / CIP 107654 / DViRD3) TaxID=1121301 RepID=A0A1M6RI92_PARC5|nr:threonine/serine dehydratase [Paramaledivibacter caminithermalis]SHK32159.1 threonine dehydratase [Paramaledivibacter caminithermalis DSM 15212]
MFSYLDVVKAYERIKDKIYKTPLDKSIYLSNENTNYYLKLECLQPVKSFKLRGALSKLTTLTEEEKKRGVVAISSGNHGAAVSYASKLLGIDNVMIFVSKATPQSKIEKIRYYGGNVKIAGENYDEVHEYGMKHIKDYDMTYIDAYYNDPIVYAGQGTVALEIFEQNPNIDTILVPIGGGGLITGISVAAKTINPDVKIIGVQTEACPAMIKALEDNVFYDTYPTKPSICEALVGGVGELAYQMARDYIDDIIEVHESFIEKAVAHIIKKEKVIAEPSSAITIAAIMQQSKKIDGRNIALVISGGNIDKDLMVSLLNKH